ncbi:MAG TPA: ATP-binding protein [Jatrophihabitantaceae bacterium]|jgi:Cdc6-like AAA superfamily ATPase
MADEDPDHLIEREREVRAAFSPSAPITRKALFAGRIEQLIQLIEAVDEPGQHVVIYGERGVGKTSLATVCKEATGGGTSAIKINCQTNDTFSSTWRKAFNEFRIVSEAPGFGFSTETRQSIVTAADYFSGVDPLTPDHVRVGLTLLTRDTPATIFFDEFDRLEQSTHRLMADTLKTLSDDVVPATVVIVGVADDVDELVSEHASIERALQQISMPRMTRFELAEIVTNGLDSVKMKIDSKILTRLTGLSQGLPHYTHLLAQQSAASAVWRSSDTIQDVDFSQGITKSLKKAQESTHQMYYQATFSPRENLYKQVLLACAAARVDDRGYFSASAVREPLSLIMGRAYDIPQFALHLNQLSSERGPVLKKEGTQKKFRYRFLNPLMQPFVLMRGLTDELITVKMLEQLEEDKPVPAVS